MILCSSCRDCQSCCDESFVSSVHSLCVLHDGCIRLSFATFGYHCHICEWLVLVFVLVFVPVLHAAELRGLGCSPCSEDIKVCRRWFICSDISWQPKLCAFDRGNRISFTHHVQTIDPIVTALILCLFIPLV